MINFARAIVILERGGYSFHSNRNNKENFKTKAMTTFVSKSFNELKRGFQ